MSTADLLDMLRGCAAVLAVALVVAAVSWLWDRL
jgi:hypothetical protein